ncbi:MAG: DUF2344 domain-containing protein, partial [Proteobacteria bacterium]|nr:DUF2344 domain-containing protein [Pseudomonadota bacterium]
QQVHDRLSLEVLRGCTHGCRFCQAGMTSRPVRERSLDKIDSLMRETLEKTGYQDVSLVSLSTCDHSQVRQLVKNAVALTAPQRVSVSLPSLRLDSFSVEMADMVAETRRTGLTVAPEAATSRLRKVINKGIDDDELLTVATAAFDRGWKHIKMYFMLGLPTETDEDVEAIAQLSLRTLENAPRGRRVHLGVSTFVPKAFTPFQWAEQISLEETRRRQELLGRKLHRKGAIQFGRHRPEETFLEGLFSRADRRAADLLEAAFRLGCRFDAWHEHLDFDLWTRAIEEVGYDVNYALRGRSIDERLPWDHIDTLVDKTWLIADYQRAIQGELEPDCRQSKCHQCGVVEVEPKLCAAMLKNVKEGRELEEAFEHQKRSPVPAPPVVQRLWFRIGKTKTARFLSHLEAMTCWLRALRRVQAPLAYSQGFHPHPQLAFSAALPMLVESVADFMDIKLIRRVIPQQLLEDLRQTLPAGLDVFEVTEVGLKEKSLMSLVQGVEYTMHLPGWERLELQDRIEAIMAQKQHIVQRTSKVRRGGLKTVDLDIGPMISSISLADIEQPAIHVTLIAARGKFAKPREFISLLPADSATTAIVRRRLIGLDGCFGLCEEPRNS